MIRAVRALIVAVSLVAPVAAAPGAHAAPPRAVRGIHAAYHGVSPATPRAVRRLYLSGRPQDQLAKLGGAPTASFSRLKPKGSQSITQVTSPLATAVGSPQWNNPFTAFWSGHFSGRISGPVSLTWYWSSVNVLQNLVPAPVDISFWADPKPDGTATLIGHGTASLRTGPTPQLNFDTLTVDGTVRHELVLGVSTGYVDVGEDLRVSYGSADAPSGFALPVGRTAAASLHTKPASYRGPKLELQSAGIGTQAGEPTIGITKDGAAFTDGGQLTIDDAIAEGGFNSDVRRSTDGGRHWKSVQDRLPNGEPNPPTSLDPYLYVDPATGRVFSVNIYGGCTVLQYSDDKGKTWTSNDFACGYPVNDHPTIVAGRPPRGVVTSGYPNVVYYCFNQAVQASCGRSLDGGNTFTPLPTPSYAFGECGGLHGHIVADSAGRIFVPTGRCGYPWIAISSDGGQSWKRVQVSSIPSYSVQTSVAADRAGNLYYVWYDASDRLPYLSRSTDHGRTWGTPVMIAPPGVRQVNWPTVDASGRGHIAISFPATTQPVPPPPKVDPTDIVSQLFGPPNNDFRGWNLYVVVSTNALARNPLFVSDTGNDPRDPINRGPCGDISTGRCGLMFDFLDIQIDSRGQAWATEVDTCTHSSGRSGVDCVKRTKATADGNPGSDSNVGVVVKQIAGPSLR